MRPTGLAERRQAQSHVTRCDSELEIGVVSLIVRWSNGVVVEGGGDNYTYRHGG
jgi:hypothetical protein